jgi:hypothetical protein
MFERNDFNFHVMYVGGPMNGHIEAGGNCLALAKRPSTRLLAENSVWDGQFPR